MDSLSAGLGFEPIELRKAGATNRQSSTEPLSGEDGVKARRLVKELLEDIEYTHRELIHLGVANECARMILPQATTTRFYLSGSCRSWIHFFEQRIDEHAQKECREVAQAIFNIFADHFPTVTQVHFAKANQETGN